MALYEFQCKKCRRKTEVIQRFSDPPPTKCPHCGGELTKLLSSPAFQFKGSGFYSTDYGKPGKKEDSSKEKEGDSSKGKEADAGAASEAKGDSAGDGPKESGKEPSKASTKDGGAAAASDAAAAKTSTAPDSPSKKNTRRK